MIIDQMAYIYQTVYKRQTQALKKVSTHWKYIESNVLTLL